MINFGNLLNEFDDKLPIIPKEIFESNIRSSKFSYLRGDQEKMLEEWYQNRNIKDTIIKMNTGGGKTTLGLLQLQSSLNEGIGPALYLSLDNQLIHQVLEDATNLGIKCVEIMADNSLPSDFLNGEAILVTTFQKLFNARSIFGIHGDTSKVAIDIGCLVIDDAHSALQKAKEAFTLKIPKESLNYNILLDNFKDSLFSQAMGSTNDILNGNDKYGILMVPYWSWLEKVPNIIKEINKDDDAIKYKWKLIRNHLEQCVVLVSYDLIEISPHCLPIHTIYSFNNAKRRIFMSATLNDDSSLIKDFGVDENSVLSPIQTNTFSDVGEKLIIAPSNVDSNISNLNWIKVLSEAKNFNIVSIVSSDAKSRMWTDNGFIKPFPSNINDILSKLNDHQGNHVVLSNRYDGIDLAEHTCRILVLDDLPQSSSLFERFAMFSRPNSKMMLMNQAQRIEQGLGRAVRSVNDYSVIFLLGKDLVSRVSNKQFQNFMSPQTVNQIKLGSKVVDLIKNSSQTSPDIIDSIKAIKAATNQVLNRDPNWIQLHKKQISTSKIIQTDKSLINSSIIELKAFKEAISGQYLQASMTIRENLSILSNSSTIDEGWFLQLAASYLYKADSSKAMELQLNAHNKNSYLLKPPHGVMYKKLTTKSSVQANKVKNYISNFTEPNAVILSINSILENLIFKPDSSAIFEKALFEIGNCLGFESQQPEKEFSIGPDVLWNLYDDEYLVIEAKNEVKLSRNKVYKSETEQISESTNWFIREYPDKIFTPLLIHPVNILDKQAIGPHNLKILNTDNLNEFKNSVKGFFGKIAIKPLDQWDAKELTAELKNYNLNKDSLKKYFSKVVY